MKRTIDIDLRTYVATAALQGVLASNGFNELPANKCASIAIECADALLKKLQMDEDIKEVKTESPDIY